MTTQHTGVVVSTAEADAWHAEIKVIMAEQQLNFGEAVNLYIERQQTDRPLVISANDDGKGNKFRDIRREAQAILPVPMAMRMVANRGAEAVEHNGFLEIRRDGQFWVKF